MSSIRSLDKILLKLANARCMVLNNFMPLLREYHIEEDLNEPDEVDRPVVSYGAVMAEIELAAHTHKKDEIILVQSGALSCEVDGGLWIVPPSSAIWIPRGTEHAIRGSGIEAYIALIAPGVASDLPDTCCVLSVPPLLRELLVRSASFPLLYAAMGPESRMVTVMLDEIAAADVENLHLPIPRDGRLRQLAEQMMASADERGTLQFWANHVGMSERTFARLLSRETGMSFGRWRRQLSVMLAVKWMAGGTTIQQIAADLGYESVPSFVTMFKKTMGTSPRRYMAERFQGK